MATLMTGVWYRLDRLQQHQIHESTSAAAKFVEILIRRDLDNRVASLERLAGRWELAGGSPRAAWQADTANYVAQQPGYRDIVWMDARMQVRWITAEPSRRPASSQDAIMVPPAWKAAALAATTMHSTALSQPSVQSDGATLLAILVPVYRGGRSDGLMVGILDATPWLADVLMQADRLQAYQVRVSLDGNDVFHRREDLNGVPGPWGVSRTFPLYGQAWTVRLAPTTSYLSTMHSRQSYGLLAFGLGFSVLAGWVVYLALAAWRRAAQLCVTRDRLATLLKNLPGMAYRCINNPRRDAEFVSEGCLGLSGYTREEFESGAVFWGDLIHADEREKLWQSMQDATGHGVAFENEYRIVTRDGTEKWVWSRGRAVQAADGQAVHLEGFITDITARKTMELALSNAEAYARAVVDNAVEAVITIDADGRIETFNQAAQRIFGYALEDIRGVNVSVLMPEPYHSEHDEYLSRYLRTGERRIIGMGRRVAGKRRDGSTFPIYLSVSEIAILHERKFVGLIRDLSDQQAAEQEARQQREALAHMERLNTLGEMATGIAHEVNQPLTAISMYAQSGIRFLGASAPSRERLQDVLEKISVQAHRAGAVIERVQQLTRRRESERVPTDCNALMSEVCKLAETEANIRNLRIVLDLCPQTPVVSVDPVQMQQVALNLLRNGMEAMVSAQPTASNAIVLSTHADQAGITISVTDIGTGVPDEVVQSLYRPFSSTKKSGMGMGLSICKSIVNAHGGQLGFHNNVSGGATFYFTLPCATGTKA